METIKDMYYRMIERDPPDDMPELAKVHKNFYEWYDTLDRETARQAEEYYGAARIYSMMQGYCWGFAYAMQIANECGMMARGAAK